MCRSFLLPCEKFPSVSRETNWWWLFLCFQGSRARFVWFHFNLFIVGVASWPDQDVPFILWPHFDLLPLFHLYLLLGLSLLSLLFLLQFCGWEEVYWEKRKEKVPLLNASFDLLFFKAKPISSAAAQDKCAQEAEVLAAVKCSWQHLWGELFERLPVGMDLIFSRLTQETSLMQRQQLQQRASFCF